jgi:hypothetical protein
MEKFTQASGLLFYFFSLTSSAYPKADVKGMFY